MTIEEWFVCIFQSRTRLNMFLKNAKTTPNVWHLCCEVDMHSMVKVTLIESQVDEDRKEFTDALDGAVKEFNDDPNFDEFFNKLK